MVGPPTSCEAQAGPPAPFVREPSLSTKSKMIPQVFCKTQFFLFAGLLFVFAVCAKKVIEEIPAEYRGLQVFGMEVSEMVGADRQQRWAGMDALDAMGIFLFLFVADLAKSLLVEIAKERIGYGQRPPPPPEVAPEPRPPPPPPPPPQMPPPNVPADAIVVYRDQPLYITPHPRKDTAIHITDECKNGPQRCVRVRMCTQCT